MIIWDIVIWYSSSKITLAKARANAKAGLEIRHFEKNSRRKKLKTQGKNSITQE